MNKNEVRKLTERLVRLDRAVEELNAAVVRMEKVVDALGRPKDDEAQRSFEQALFGKPKAKDPEPIRLLKECTLMAKKGSNTEAFLGTLTSYYDANGYLTENQVARIRETHANLSAFNRWFSDEH